VDDRSHIGFCETIQDQPAFVNLWLDDTHTPWVPSAEAADDGRKDTQPKLKQVLTEMDRQLGRMMDEIRAFRDRPTLVVFMGDNGPLPTFAQSRTAGLRGAKLSLYEGGIREPLIAWWPGKIPAGKVNENTVVSSLDFFPTFLEIAGAKMPSGTFDGQNMAPTLFGAEPIRAAALFWEYARNTNSFAFPGDPKNRSPNVAMREGNWKLIVQADGSRAELYDLEKDRNEQSNLANEQPERTRQMTEAALRWRRSLP